MAIAVQSAPEDIRELKEMFQALDKDGNGSITFDELQHGLGDRENGEQLLTLLKAADTDGSGTINYSGKCGLGPQLLNQSQHLKLRLLQSFHPLLPHFVHL